MSVFHTFSKTVGLYLSILVFIAAQLFSFLMLLDGHKQKYGYRIPHALDEACFNAVLAQTDPDTLASIISDADISHFLSQYDNEDFKDPGEALQDGLAETIFQEIGTVYEGCFIEICNFFHNDIEHSFNHSPEFTMRLVRHEQGNDIVIDTFDHEGKWCLFNENDFSESLGNGYSLELEICICGMIFRDIIKMMIPFFIMDICLIVLLLILFLNRKKEHKLAWISNRFSSMAIHDIKNNLSVIYSANEALSADKAVKNSNYLSTMSGIVGHRIKEMHLDINKVLGILKSDSKTIQRDYVDVDLSGLVSNIVNDYSAVNPSVQFINEVPVGTEIHTEPSLLKNAIANIISNSIKYSKETPLIRISLIPLKRKRVRLVIKDNGIGISKAELKRIFTYGYMLDPSTEGQGIGLFSIMYMSESMGWDIKIESEKEKGTSVSLALKTK